MPKFVCPKCGKYVSTKEEHCLNCGYEFTYCPECKKVWVGKVNFCPTCGKSTKPEIVVADSATETPADVAETQESKVETPQREASPDSQIEVKEKEQAIVKEEFFNKPKVAKYKTWEECCPDEKPSFKRRYVAGMVLSIIGFALLMTYILVCALSLINPSSLTGVRLYIVNFVSGSFFTAIILIFLIIGSLINCISTFKTRRNCINWLQNRNIDGAEYVKEQIKFHNANSLGGKDKLFFKIVKEACYLSKNNGMNGLVIASFIMELINDVIMLPAFYLLVKRIFSLIYIMSVTSLTSAMEIIYIFILIIIFTIALSVLKIVFDNKVKNWVNAELIKD